ncbi:hypothetical protein CL176_00955 [Suicoccus acidiformans]|uniref:Cell envelope-related transcriptional attenuator domain-containing protein n=1 Tax=Suicoccus acidiformans TaxID=2036206 RepID=A0A347WI03_9LACT|nr:LCP family protein [Suicoccus acidiformans]AXY24710.1 hypothetical protein CL176_00955 [Suicoccus acidiformans]
MKRFIVMVLMVLCCLGFVMPQVSAEESVNGDTMSVLLLGTDTGAEGRTDHGRSDVIMVATVNPGTGRVTLTSIPRDTYVDIPGYGMDKINHAYAFGGAELTMEAVNQLLDIQLDHYIVVNMAGIQEIVDTIGGIEVTPPVSFSIGGYDFTEGQTTTLDGNMALQYARERYTSGGDYARQERQRDILVAIYEEVTSMGVADVLRLGRVGMALNDNLEMSVSLTDFIDIATSIGGSIKTVETYQLYGTGEMIDGVYYDIPDEASLAEVTNTIHQELN